MDESNRTIAELDAEIAAEHALEQAAYDRGQDGIAEWYALDIERLSNLRRITAEAAVADELRATQRRHLSERYAEAMWSGDKDAAALIQAAIEKFERT